MILEDARNTLLCVDFYEYFSTSKRMSTKRAELFTSQIDSLIRATTYTVDAAGTGEQTRKARLKLIAHERYMDYLTSENAMAEEDARAFSNAIETLLNASGDPRIDQKREW